MLSFFNLKLPYIFALLLAVGPLELSFAQSSSAPRVVVPTGNRSLAPSRPVAPSSRALYPWKTHITATIFWIGEKPAPRNPTPNDKSSWDTKWAKNYGGYDNPDPAQRIANHKTGDFRPKKFIPKLNPFYIALPYNDVKRWDSHKPEASRVVPWFSRMRPTPGRTVLKGRWVQIYYNNRSCYAQWEDCGPWVTDDWQYVFGNSRPKAKQNGSAGIDLSPSIRDYLGLRSGDKVHWRFVEDAQVPYGPWKRYVTPESLKPPHARRAPRLASSKGSMSRPGDNESIEKQREYLEYLKKLRDAQFQKKPLKDL